MQKYIVTSDGRFKYGDVNMHKDLLAPGESCLGGGFYEFDYIHNRLILSGRSYDFGRPAWGAIDSLILPAAFRDLEVYYEDLPVTDFVPVEYTTE